MAETNAEEPMPHGDDAQNDGVAAAVQDTMVNNEVEEVVNNNEVSNMVKEPCDCVMLEGTTKTVLQEMVNIVWPMKFEEKINWQAAQEQFDLPEGFVFNPDPHKVNGIHYRALCNAIGTMKCVVFNSLPVDMSGGGHIADFYGNFVCGPGNGHLFKEDHPSCNAGKARYWKQCWCQRIS